METKFVKVSNANSHEYLGKILSLQDEVYERLAEEGKKGQFFKSSKEEIEEYVNAKSSIVTACLCGEELASVCYLTMEHTVYNNLTLYIKGAKPYRDTILSTSSDLFLLAKYIDHLAKYRSLRRDNVITDKILADIDEKAKNNDFYEDNELRQKVANILYQNNILNDPDYPWLLFTDLPFSDDFISIKDISTEYDSFISKFGYHYFEQPQSFFSRKLFQTLAALEDNNVCELDTYFSAPKYRNKGLTSALIKWSLEEISKSKNIVAFSATVHPENLISQHILKNIGFEKFCTVERRKGILRDVMFKY